MKGIKFISQKRKKIGRYLLPNDLDKGYSHERGMVSMPSSLVDNPYKMASPFEFFIVQSKSGAHHLNGNYTVFGKVISGMNTVDKIAATPTATAALDKYSTNSLCPPLFSPNPPGC